MARMLTRAAAPAFALILTGCATVPASPPPVASADDCKLLMLTAGFIAEHHAPLRLRPLTTDVSRLTAGRVSAEVPETWSPDADGEAIAAVSAARRVVRPLTIACPLEKSPFVPWRPGRGELVLSTPARSPKGDFAVLDAAVLLPGRRVDLYRFMLSGPPKEGWDFHRLEFGSAPLGFSR